ncbi:MAG TPA: C25 family cysteine peptidase [Candidatus Ozemobacteraceae bacterium]
MKKFLSVLALVVCFCGAAFAAEIVLPEANGTGISIVSEASRGGDMAIRLTCSIDKLNSWDVETPRGPFTVLQAPSFYFGGEYGAPQLPVLTRLVQIPFGAEYKVVVKSFDTTEYDLAKLGIEHQIFPRQPSAPKDGSKVPFVYEKSAYISKGFNGLPIASLKDAGVMRQMRLAQLTIAPVKYNAVENRIEVYNNIEVEIVLTGGDMAKTRLMHESLWTPAYAWLEQMVAVPQALRFAPTRAQQSYVIVTTPAFKDAIAPFAAAKAEKGFKVDVVTTDQFGTGAAITTGLKAYLHGLYNNATPDRPAPSYVLFVGDNEQIPAFKGQTGSHITDLYYVAVTPGDFLPDMLTGRFSAQTLDQLTPQIEKTMEYEKAAFADPSFLDDVVLVAGWDSSWAKSHGWPHINYATKYFFNKEHGFRTVNAYLSAGSQQNVPAIQAAIAKGASYVNYTAHGSATSWADPGMSISDINKLGNKGKYPFVVGNCCLTNKFEVATCFGEAWLRAKDAGAIGYVGGSNSTYWDEDIWWGIGLHAIVKPNEQGVPPAIENTGVGAIDALFEGNGVSNAAFMQIGNLAVEASTSSRKQYYWEVYHLMGDPALKTYLGQPKS